MDTRAVLSSCVRPARCSLPSAPPPRRPPRSEAVSDSAQFALPFLIEPQRGGAHKANASEMRPAASAGSLSNLCPAGYPAEKRSKIDDNGKRSQQGTPRAGQPATETVPTEGKLLASRKVAAHMLSISVRAVDYLVSTKKLATRRIGARVMIPVEEIRRFARSDHPDRMAG
jgi:hypothetical protein